MPSGGREGRLRVRQLVAGRDENSGLPLVPARRYRGGPQARPKRCYKEAITKLKSLRINFEGYKVAAIKLV